MICITAVPLTSCGINSDIDSVMLGGHACAAKVLLLTFPFMAGDCTGNEHPPHIIPAALTRRKTGASVRSLIAVEWAGVAEELQKY